MMDLKISQMPTAPVINSDAYIPLIQLNGADEVNYKADAILISPWLAPALENLLTIPTYVKTWNANANVPTLTSSLGDVQTVYIVSENGTTSLNGVSSWSIGEMAYFNGSVWEKKSVNINGVVPITYNNITGDVGLSFNATNLQLSGSDLNTIQDISTTATPTFADITINEWSGLEGSIPIVENDGSVSFSTTFVYNLTGSSFGVGVTTSNVNSKFQHVGTYAIGVSTISASANTDSIDNYIIGVTLTSPQVTVTLGTLSSVAGRVYEIKDQTGTANTTPIIVTPLVGTIDGQSSIQIVSNYGILRVYFDGSNWFTR